MKIRFFIIILFVVSVLTLFNDQAFALCDAEINYDSKLKNSEFVFTGTVTRLDNYDGPQKVTFFIHDVIKGEINTPKHVLENSGKIFHGNDSVESSSVSVDYKIGKTYKVYIENGETSRCTTKTTVPPTDYVWEPGPEDGNYYSENPVWTDPCDEGYGLSDGVCITLEEMNKDAPPRLEPDQDSKQVPNPEPEPEPVHDIPIYYDCGPGTVLQDGVCIVTSESKPDKTNGQWGEPSYEKFPPPDLRASCAFDGVIAMWFYKFIVNPLCEVGVQIIPDYECHCDT